MGLFAVEWRPDPRQLRWFAGGWLVVPALPAALALARTGTMPAWAAVLAAAALAGGTAGLVRPPLLLPLWRLLVTVTWPVGLVASFLLLALVYYGLLTPVGLVRRLAGRDPLGRRRHGAAASFWQGRRNAARVERYFRQY